MCDVKCCELVWRVCCGGRIHRQLTTNSYVAHIANRAQHTTVSVGTLFLHRPPDAIVGSVAPVKRGGGHVVAIKPHCRRQGMQRDVDRVGAVGLRRRARRTRAVGGFLLGRVVKVAGHADTGLCLGAAGYPACQRSNATMQQCINATVATMEQWNSATVRQCNS